MDMAEPAGTPDSTGANEDLAAQLASLRDELATLKQAVAGSGQASSGSASCGCNCAACADAAGQVAQHATEHVRSAIAGAEGFVRENPAAALGGALGVGVLLGLLLTRR